MSELNAAVIEIGNRLYQADFEAFKYYLKIPKYYR